MKVLIVDDDALIRDSLQIILSSDQNFEITGTASNGQEAFKACISQRPDIVLMDVRMPVMDGVLGTKLIKEHFKNIKVLILTTFKDDEYIKEAIKNGAEGYILKNRSAEDIKECLRMVHRGNMVLQKDVADSITGMLSNGKHGKAIEGLTDREMEIVKLIGTGLSNREIASKLYLSDGTVRNYITNLLEKLNLRDRTQLAIFYVKNFDA